MIFLPAGDLGLTPPGEISESWNYRYTSGPLNGQTFTVNLKGEISDTGEHRIYQREDPNGEISNYLECNLGRRNLSIVQAGTREGFNITNGEISGVKDGEIFHGTRYAWVPHLRRDWTTTLGDYFRNYLIITIIDKNQPGYPYVNNALIDIPYDSTIEGKRVMGYSFFAEGIGEFLHIDYAYKQTESGNIVRDPDNDSRYELDLTP